MPDDLPDEVDHFDGVEKTLMMLSGVRRYLIPSWSGTFTMALIASNIQTRMLEIGLGMPWIGLWYMRIKMESFTSNFVSMLVERREHLRAVARNSRFNSPALHPATLYPVKE